MKIKSKKILISLTVLITLFSLTAFAYGEETNMDAYDIRKSTDLPLDDNEILEMIEKNTPSINPKEFEEKKNNKNTFAVYGELPEKDGIDSYDWHLLLLTISKSVQKDSDFEKYGYGRGGPVVGYGATYEGGYMAIYIALDHSKQLKKEDLENIRDIFEKHANENGIQNLPIVIEYQNAIYSHSLLIEEKPVTGMKNKYIEFLKDIKGNLPFYNYILKSLNI